jgi:hypothetical protein
LERDNLNQRGNLLKELKIFDFPNARRVRIGSDNDGGYVLLDHELEAVEVIYSYGVGNNSDFEAMFCEKYNAIARLYDHTVDSAPLKKKFFYFKKEGVGAKKDEDRNTIENHLNENGDSEKRLLLQMDVDGAEWDTLIHMSNSVLNLFDQIVIEVHGLSTDFSEALNGGEVYSVSLDKKIKVFRKINELFYLYHVHANTEGGLHFIGWFKVPDVLELTYVNKKMVKNARPSEVIFPTEFDQPNVKGRKDQDLHFWPFYPGMAQHFIDTVRRNSWKSWRYLLKIPYARIKMNLRSIRTLIGLRR